MGGEISFFYGMLRPATILNTMGFAGMGGDTLTGLNNVEPAENKTSYT